jgi:hypothetical protein
VCECGCGEFSPSYQFAGPDGLTYTLSIYPGCKDCETPAGVVINRMTPEDVSEWDVASVPQLPIVAYSKRSVSGECGIPVLDSRLLTEKIAEAISPLADVAKEYDSASDMLSDSDMPDIVTDAVCETLEKYRKTKPRKRRQ